jgi:hypothetical protein
MGLLTDIENAATNSSIPVNDILRKCLVLAAKLKHKELAEWSTNELNGYTDKEKVPTYRIIHLSSPIGHFQGAFGGC